MSAEQASVDDSCIGQVVDAHAALAGAGQGDMIWGHVGVRDPLGRGVWSKASGWGMEEITPDNVVLVDFDGRVVAGRGERHLEVFIHLEVMRARPDVGASVHSHALEATVFASLDEPLRAITHAATPFLDGAGEGNVVRFTETGDLIRTPELGASLANTIGESNGCLIPGHGLVTVGTDAASAVLHAVLLNNACKAHVMAASAGGPRRWSSPDEVAAKRTGLWPPKALGSAFTYLVRRARVAEQTSQPTRESTP